MTHRLCVFLRSDLESMTPGKAAAQVAHAATQHAMRYAGELKPTEATLARKSSHDFFNWADSYHFGTTIVLDGGSFEPSVPEEIAQIMNVVYAETEGASRNIGRVIDPSYPIRDGKVTHLLSLTTCVWIFYDPEEDPYLDSMVKRFKLYSGNHD